MGFLAGKSDSSFVGNLHFETATPSQIEHGKALVIERGCASCHEINGVKKPDNFAPELTAVGSRPLAKITFAPGVAHTLPDYIAAKIRNPRSFGSALKMPQYTLAPRQVDALVTALLAQTERAQNLPASLRIPARTAVGLSSRRESRTVDRRHVLLQLPLDQRPWRRHGARISPGRALRCSAPGWSIS